MKNDHKRGKVGCNKTLKKNPLMSCLFLAFTAVFLGMEDVRLIVLLDTAKCLHMQLKKKG